jgi:hypothetical protein
MLQDMRLGFVHIHRDVQDTEQLYHTRDIMSKQPSTSMVLVRVGNQDLGSDDSASSKQAASQGSASDEQRLLAARL